MSTDMAVRQTVQLSTEQLKFIANTEFVPSALRGNIPAILACVATGRELGIGDMTALRSVHLIDGRATFSAELMGMLVRRAGHSIVGKVDADSATVTGTRADNGDTMTVTWTTAMAERAGLLKKSNWVKYTESMLFARAVSQLCRALFPDCFAGATYTDEELADTENSTTAEGVIERATPTPPGHDARSTTPDAEPPPVDDDWQFPPKDTPKGLTIEHEKRLDFLVGSLRREGHLTTEHLWRGCGYEPELSEDGLLHWRTLRARLTDAEGVALIERLSKLKAAVEKKPFEIPEAAREAPQ